MMAVTDTFFYAFVLWSYMPLLLFAAYLRNPGLMMVSLLWSYGVVWFMLHPEVRYEPGSGSTTSEAGSSRKHDAGQVSRSTASEVSSTRKPDAGQKDTTVRKTTK